MAKSIMILNQKIVDRYESVKSKIFSENPSMKTTEENYIDKLIDFYINAHEAEKDGKPK
jgi:hypothetical protein